MTKVYTGSIDLADRNSSWTKIVTLIGESKRVLEVGCASGYMSAFLTHSRACKVTGVEVDPDAARSAAPHCHRLIIGDVETGVLETLADRFDVIVFADVLEHLKDPTRVLRASRYLLTEAGYVVISLPNVAHWEVRRQVLFGRFEYTRSGILD
ncbi:MAG: class I SAM-dependent methyltransferase, partial [Acidimicrobiia bacterium]